MKDKISYKTNIGEVDWEQMKAILADDDFDNGRSPEQLQKSFKNSYRAVVAYDGQNIIGTARVLSDGVCNAYVVDVWTFTPYRNQAIASKMIKILEADLKGQHVYLFTQDANDFYFKIGFKEQPSGMSKIIGEWLNNNSKL